MTVAKGNDDGAGTANEPPIRQRTFFDVHLGGLSIGRIVFELYTDVAPKTVENFRSLCVGDTPGVGKVTGKRLHYKGVIFHRVVKDFMVQSGDFSAGNGTGGESIYGGTFDDENFTLKHDKPFLLSMANRGKNTNGSQFFITTQPAPHLDNIHVVFGHVVSGHDLVRQLEHLPVDRNSRPLQDAKIANCGELVRQIKVKKIKRNKKSNQSSNGDSSSSEEDSSKKKKKDKKKSKKKQKEKERKESSDENNSESDAEEGEIEAGTSTHPMVSLSKIDPKDIPEVSNKFLMRAGRRSQDNEEAPKERTDRDDSDGRRRDRRRDDDRRDNKNFGWSKNRAPLSRSGRVIKGRGVFRYRTPSRSRSRSRSVTPPHWKQAQKRTIKLSELEQFEEEKRVRDAEIKRREADRKKRHEELAQDRKKSFFELNQRSPKSKPPAKRTPSPKASDRLNRSKSCKEDGELDTTHERSALVSVTGDGEKYRVEIVNKSAPMQNEIDLNALDYEMDRDENNDDSAVNKKSESMALAFGMEIKSEPKSAGDALKRSDKSSTKHHRGDEKKLASDKRSGVERRTSRGRSRDRSRERNTQSSRRGGGGGGRNRSRSVEESRHARRRSSDRRRRNRTFSRSNSRSRRDNNRTRRNRSRSRHRNNRSRSNDRRTSRRSSDRNKETSSRRDHKDEPQRGKSKTPEAPPKIDVEDKERINKEKMIKRAEVLVLMKERMRKEIEEQNRRQAEKDRIKEQVRADELDLARLELIKKETLEKLKVQEEIKQLTAVKKVMEVVATVQQISRKRSQSRSLSPRSKSKFRTRSSSRSSSSDRSRRKGSDKRRRRRQSDTSSSD